MTWSLLAPKTSTPSVSGVSPDTRTSCRPIPKILGGACVDLLIDGGVTVRGQGRGARAGITGAHLGKAETRFRPGVALSTGGFAHHQALDPRGKSALEFFEVVLCGVELR